ncbi:hypothetical protein BKA69DRAFT_465569 [Paraphysoderma sedebokerense]|nr:hypothetical protein BKA69DRAFT_465569 [Paraphysoderma sedebokerense]
MYITSNPIHGTLFQLSISGEKGALIDTVSGPIAVTHFAFRVLYIPHKDFNGNDTFNFKARDIWNTDSSIQTAQIDVVSVPDPPIPQSQVYEMDEDTELSFILNTTDPDTAKLDQVVIILSLPQKGLLFMPSDSNGTSWNQIAAIPQVLSLNATLKYRPFSNMYGIDTFDYMANDGYFNSSLNGTITFRVNPVNDPPYLNITNLNFTIYEDTETVFQFNISDIDINDKLTVKITDVHINGSMYLRDLQRGTTVLLGEGSEIKGPPFEVLYIPSQNFFTATIHDIQKFNITYADALSAELSHQITFPVLAVNDPPVLLCATPQIELPTTFVVGTSRNHSFTLQASDVDNTNFTYILASAPRQGALKSANGRKLITASSFDSPELIFDAEKSGGGYPYSNFTIYVMDPWNSTSNNCTFVFTFACPLGLYNNIFSNETGEICAPCPSGAVCSTDGKILPVLSMVGGELKIILHFCHAFLPKLVPVLRTIHAQMDTREFAVLTVQKIIIVLVNLATNVA